MQDRKDYERNVTKLEDDWAGLIEDFAAKALRDNAKEADSEAQIDSAIEDVTRWLLDDTRWEGVEAIDISDIAYEAVNREYDSTR